MTLDELLTAMQTRHAEVDGYSRGLSTDQFFAAPEGRWSPAQHLLHLEMGHTAMAGGLNAPERLPLYSDSPRSDDEVREVYLAALKARPLVNNPFIRPVERTADAGADQEAVLDAYRASNERLQAAVRTWADADLDTRAMPHPLIGLLSVREMLGWALYHDGHHLAGMRRQVGG